MFHNKGHICTGSKLGYPKIDVFCGNTKRNLPKCVVPPAPMYAVHTTMCSSSTIALHFSRRNLTTEVTFPGGISQLR